MARSRCESAADNGDVKDNCYLQLYNKGGVSWNEGMPKDPPPAAKGMKLVFADDFNGPLSIASDNAKATYYDHKPPNGWQDFSIHTFSGHESPKNPFAQVDTYLRIRASDKIAQRRPHLLAQERRQRRQGVSALLLRVPLHRPQRHRHLAGVLAADGRHDPTGSAMNQACDELDIIEAYGGEGPHEPNADRHLHDHAPCLEPGRGRQPACETRRSRRCKNPCRMRKFGIPSTWFEAFHTYGCKITETDTIYYCDNIEVGRHATLPI